MRIATYNVHRCIGQEGRAAPERIAAVIAEMDPDVVCLQEVDVGRARTGAVDQAAEIARLLTMGWQFHPTIHEFTGQYGDAILSKTPVHLVRAAHFPAVPRPLPREARGVLWIETTVGGECWQILNTHFGLGHGERRLQARALVEDWITPALARSPVVLCGDLNSRPASTVHRILGGSLTDIFRGKAAHPLTFSTRWPLLCLDYILTSSEVRVLGAARHSSLLAQRASDHYPLVAELTCA